MPLARTAARVSAREAAASDAASAGVNSVCRRVLTRPANGSLASTITACGPIGSQRLAHRLIAALMSRTARQAPSGVPVTFDRPSRGR